ncbi:MAG TPA: potassium channel protein, partial [Planctomycetaceae bacterium]|nr:potassium channel protein [Planctomycetaceae bacterium]
MNRFLTIVGLLVALVVTGMVGIRYFTGLPWIESLYDAVILLTTVGCREPFPLTSSGMIFVIIYLVSGLGVFTYGLSQLGRWMVEVRLQTILERRRMEREKEIAKLRDHYVVCGNGRMGEVICEYLAHRDKDFVVIDIDEDRLVPTCVERGWLYI